MIIDKYNHVVNTKPKILIFNTYYLPGYKAGGPIRSIESICDAVGDFCELYIVTSDRDLGDTEPYRDIKNETWNTLGKVNVCYKPNRGMTINFIKTIIAEIQPDVIHLNSLMSVKYSFLPVIVNNLFQARKIKVLLSPRGGLSKGALNIKSFRKSIYLFCLRIFRTHKLVEWIASSDGEKSDIERIIGNYPTIHRVDNMPSVGQWKEKLVRTREKKTKSLKLVFFSRIAKMKNLEYVVELLAKLDLKIELDIYGPEEDKKYSDLIKSKIETLPDNIKVSFRGTVKGLGVYEVLKEYDLFILPTYGENFGQAIWEALASSVPVLISNNTPWKNLESKGVGKEISLARPEEFSNYIRKIYDMDNREHVILRECCRNFAMQYVLESESVKRLLKLYSLK